jgi:hypothetical protein
MSAVKHNIWTMGFIAESFDPRQVRICGSGSSFKTCNLRTRTSDPDLTSRRGDFDDTHLIQCCAPFESA